MVTRHVTRHFTRHFTRHSWHGHKAPRQASINMATDENVTDSSREDFFSALVNLLDICKYHSLNVNLDFPSAAILFNQLDVTVSVLRSISDGVANLPCVDQLQELCLCFSEIYMYWWNRMVEIGKTTTSIADLRHILPLLVEWEGQSLKLHRNFWKT